MVNEREDKYEPQDEGEYHFSDDQVSYDMDETVKSSASGSPAAVATLSQFRRPIVGMVVFIVLVFVIYKMLAPANTTQSTDISSQNSTTVTTVTKKTLKAQTAAEEAAAKQQAALQAQQQQAAQLAQQQAAAQQAQLLLAQQQAQQQAQAQQLAQQQAQLQAQQQVQQPAVQSAQPTQQSVQQPPLQQPAQAQQPQAIPMPSAMQAPTQMPQPQQQQYVQTVQQTAPMTAPIAVPGTNQQPPVVVQQAPSQEDQSARLAEAQEQNMQLREQVQELTTRIATMERNMNRLMTALGSKGAAVEYGGPQAQNRPPMPIEAVPPPPKAEPEPKIAYSVQAIIPGRAWLKSVSGDTITVAEGDKLKGIGRITKIDPYDGIVEIDTGSRVVALSYGLNGD